MFRQVNSIIGLGPGEAGGAEAFDWRGGDGGGRGKGGDGVELPKAFKNGAGGLAAELLVNDRLREGLEGRDAGALPT